MEQLVKFISDSISDMNCRGAGVGSYERSVSAAPSFATDGKTCDDRWIENSNDPRFAMEEKPVDANDPEPSASFSRSAGESRGPEEWSVSGRHCGITPPAFVDGCKFPESCETSQDVVQQSQVSSSKSPSVLANDIIGPLLLEALDGFLFMVDKRNEIQFISENVTQYLKYTKEDLIGNSIFNLIHFEDHEFFTKALDVLMFDASCKSPSFTCRMLIKQPGKGQPVYDKMQITTTIQSYPFESKSNPGSQLVACVARRIGVPKPNMPSTEIEQFTTKQDVKGVILDTCGLNPDNFGFSNLIGQNIQNFCHVNDKPQLFKHHREVLSSGTNTSGVYRFKLKEDKYVFVQTKSQLFKNPANPKLDFVMSTHSIVKECCDDNELKGTASSSLVKAIIGQTGNKSKMRHQQSTEDSFGDFQSIQYQYHKADVGDGDSNATGMHSQYWRGGRASHHVCGTAGSDRPVLQTKSRGRGDRLTTRPVGRPRLHPGGFASSRLHSQMSKSSEVEQDSFRRDGCPPAVWSNPRRRRRQQHLPHSNSVTMGCEDEMYSQCSLNKHATGAGAIDGTENIAGFDPKNNFVADVENFGSQRHHLQKEFGQEMSSSVENFTDLNNSADFLPASEQSFLDELLAETSEIGDSFLSDDFCMDFDESILDEVTKQNPRSNFTRSSFNFTPVDCFSKPIQQNFNQPLSFAPPSNDVRSSGTSTFKRTDFRGTLADDRTHLTDLLVDGKVGDRSRKEVWSHKISDKKKDKGGSNSNIILKKLLSQEDEENEDDDDSQGNGSHESGGRVLALLAQGTAIGEVFPGGICKQLKKELENNSLNNNNVMNGNNNNDNGNNKTILRSIEDGSCSLPRPMTAYEGQKKLYQLGDRSNVSRGSLRLLEEALNNNNNNNVSENVACKERQNVLLKELLNEKSNLSTPSVQSKLLKSLLASDEANFGALEERCSMESNVGLLPIVERNLDDRFFTDDAARNFGNSGNNDNIISDDFLSSSFSLDFDCMTNCDQDPPIKVFPLHKINVGVNFDSLNRSELSSTPTVGPDASSLSMALESCNTSKSDLVLFEKSKEEGNMGDVYRGTGGKSFFDNSSSSFISTRNADKKLFNNAFNSVSHSLTGQDSMTSASDSSAFSFPQDLEQSKSVNSVTKMRPSRKNILLAQLLSRTSDEVPSSGVPAATTSSSGIFPTRNASSIAVVTPMVHLLKQNNNRSSPQMSGKDTSEESKEKMEFASKKVKADDAFEKIQPRAKPSASLQPFRCQPTYSQQQSYLPSPIPSFSSSSAPLFSPPSLSTEIFTAKTQLHCSGGTMEHANDSKFAGDVAPVGIVPRFDSCDPTSEATRCSRVKSLDAQQLLQHQNKTSDLKILEDNLSWAGNGRQVSSDLEPSSVLPDGDGRADDDFSASGKIGFDPPNARSSSDNNVDALVKNNGQSSNVCSTRPFIAQPPSTSSSALPASLASDEDPFSTTYSPISPALQDENSQEVLSSNVATNFLQGSITSDDIVGNDAGNDVVKAVAGNFAEDRNSFCTPQMINNQQIMVGNNCKKVQCAEDDNGFGFAYSGVQMQSNFSNSGWDWNDGMDSNGRMLLRQHEKHGTIISGEGHISNQDRISRKRLHSDVFAPDRPVVDAVSWHANDRLARNDPPPFDGVNQQQQMIFQKHRVLGDSKRHLGIHPEFMGNQVHSPFQGQGHGMIFGKMHSQVRFNAVQETFPPYQMEREWGQARWIHGMSSLRHKTTYSPGDYQSLCHDRPCYMGPQTGDKIAVVKQPRQYFHSQMHLQQPVQPFMGHQRTNPVPSFASQYAKHEVGPNFTAEYSSCCNLSDCPADLPGRTSVYEMSNYSGHLGPPNHHHNQQQQSMFHQQQLHHLAHQQHQFMQQAPQHFQTESYEGTGRKLNRRDSGQFDVVRRQLRMQPRTSAFDSERSASFCDSSYPADQKSFSSSIVDDSLRIHPDSGLLDFPAEEVSGQSAGRRTSDPLDGIGPSKDHRLDPATVDEANCPTYAERSVAWGNDEKNLQSFNNSLKNSIMPSNADDDVSLTKEYLRKELRNICTARSQQQNKTDDFENGDPSREVVRESSLGANGGSSTFDARGARLRNPTGNDDKTETKTQDGSASGREGNHEAEDIFKSISFTDVESDTFWSNLSLGDEDKMTLNCDDLF